MSNINSSVFKDKTGRYRTLSLFKETNTLEDTYPSIYTLKDEDNGSCISFRRKYLELLDPTEYTVATTLLGSWEHWQRLTQCAWFQEYLESIRLELKTKLNSEAFKRILTTSMGGGQRAYEATKLVYETTKSNKVESKRGRPTKDEKLRQLKIETELDDQLNADALRVGVED